jgi:hypothetical protein
MLTAAEVAPSFHMRQRLVAEDLPRLDEPCVIFEHHGRDSDGASFFVYTIGGYLDGRPLLTAAPWAVTSSSSTPTVARTRTPWPRSACRTRSTPCAARTTGSRTPPRRWAGWDRSPIARMEAATKPASDISDDFVRDSALIRPLIGDDIVLTGS